MIRSLYYHNPNVEGFEKIIQYLKSRKYTFLSIWDLRNKINNKDFAGKNVFISFDDGWSGNLCLLPVLEKYNIPITIFVSVKPILQGNFWWEYVVKDRGYIKTEEFKKLSYYDFYSQLNSIKGKIGVIQRSALTLEELKEISQHPLVSIQSHTINHPILTHLPDKELYKELLVSKEWLENTIQKEVFAFSYPNGSLSDREVNAAKNYYEFAFTTEQRNIQAHDDKFLLPRYALTGDYKRDLLKMYGIWGKIKSVTSLIKK